MRVAGAAITGFVAGVYAAYRFAWHITHTAPER